MHHNNTKPNLSSHNRLGLGGIWVVFAVNIGITRPPMIDIIRMLAKSAPYRLLAAVAKLPLIMEIWKVRLAMNSIISTRMAK